jgi:hypothetical protein
MEVNTDKINMTTGNQNCHRRRNINALSKSFIMFEDFSTRIQANESAISINLGGF